MDIHDIPDYPALEQLANALWKAGKARGAAVLVGAGFSRNAERLHGNTREPPLWTDIARVMQARIYPKDGTPKDPLRLAEEFRVLLGEAALEGLIRDLVRDEEWLPGQLHKRLVQLPWTDILTTNWDTLLERAALENLGQTYETVRCIGDIATTRAPRIVKLHGSLPSNRPFILTEEDYRTYPRVFAPFVNLVQETLLENELCLLGFSGDDPNFLEWSGWVRDQLGASARRIHLVGALELSPAERRLFESRNVSVIDLTPLLDCDNKTRHSAAAAAFLDFLEKSKPRAPWDWPEPHRSAAIAIDPRGTPVEVLARALELLKTWEADRRSYPGWVVCPAQIREAAIRETIGPLHWTLKPAFEHLAPKDRGRLVFETAWRHETFFVPIQDWLSSLFREAVLNDECWSGGDSLGFVAMTLLRTAREERNRASFAEWAAYLEAIRDPEPEIASQLRYQRCLWARDELKFRELKELLAELDGSDPLWKLRRAALFCDLGDVKVAREVANAGLREIREHFYRDRDSVWTISRLAWAQFLSRGLRSWTERAKDDPWEESELLRLRVFETKADPWGTLQAIDIKVEEDLRTIAKRNRTTEPRFDPGVYREHMTLDSGTWWPTESIYAMWRTTEVAGIPSRADHSVIMAERMERAEVLTGYRYEDESDYLRVLRVAHAGGGDLIESVFGRDQVAVISANRCAMLREVLIHALDYSLERLKFRKGFADDFWSSRAAVYAEIISRLSVRLAGADAVALFRRGLAYAEDLRWKALELHEPLEHLLARSLSAVPPEVRRTLITEIVSFPLPLEAGVASEMARDWPEPAAWLTEALISRPDPDNKFAVRISVLTEKVASSDAENRSRAARRLTHLFLAGALNAEEAARFGSALWSRRKSDTDLPADTTLYSHMFLLLPSPDKGVTRSLFVARDHEPSSADYLISLAGATRRQRDGSRALTLTREEALGRLRGILDWRPSKEPGVDLGNIRGLNRLARQAVGAALADAVFPFLDSVDVTSAIIDECVSLIDAGVAPSATQAVPELVRIQPSFNDRATAVILRMMFSHDKEKCSAGLHAVYRWVAMSKERVLPEVPRRFVDSVLYMIEARRQPGLLLALKISQKLLDSGALTQVERERIVTALGFIFIETDYPNQEPKDPETNTITFVRAAAIRLAVALRSHGTSDERLGDLLADAECDPMPEVRFAVESSED